MRQFTWVFEDAKNTNIENVIILAGDHLYRMDYMDLVQVFNYLFHICLIIFFFVSFSMFSDYLVSYKQSHIDRNADITVSCAAVGDRYFMFSHL